MTRKEIEAIIEKNFNHPDALDDWDEIVRHAVDAAAECIDIALAAQEANQK